FQFYDGLLKPEDMYGTKSAGLLLVGHDFSEHSLAYDPKHGWALGWLSASGRWEKMEIDFVAFVKDWFLKDKEAVGKKDKGARVTAKNRGAGESAKSKAADESDREQTQVEKIKYKNGSWAEIQKASGKENGWWIVYNADGSKTSERHYVSGKQFGPDRSWNED